MKKQIYKVLSLIIIAGFFTSCLKDDRLILDPAKGHNVIEFANPGTIVTNGSVYPLYSFAFNVIPEGTIPVSVSYSGPEATAPQDITVKLGVGTQVELDAYKADQGTAFEILDPSLYSLSATEVIIKKGTSKASFNVNVKANKFDLSRSYALPLKIMSASSGIVSGNFNTILLSVVVKNKYDGVYKVTGTLVDKADPTISHINDYLGGDGPMEYQLRTLTATKCEVYDDFFFGGYYTPITSGSAYSNYGSFCIIIEFDPATDKVIAVTNRFGQPATNGRSAKLDPTGQNVYNSADKKMAIKYNMVGGLLSTGPNDVRSTWDEVWEFKEERP